MSRLADYALSGRLRRLLRSLVPVVCPPDVERLGLVDEVVDHCELTMRAFPAPVRSAFLLGLATYNVAALGWLPGRGRPASRLTGQSARAYFATWWESPIPLNRELAVVVKAIMALAYYEMPAVKAELGYQPDAWIEKVKTRRLAVYRGEITRHQQSLIAPDPLPSRAPSAAPAAAGENL
jgi:hypothetical protein